jgi:hypothetical protein
MSPGKNHEKQFFGLLAGCCWRVLAHRRPEKKASPTREKVQ